MKQLKHSEMLRRLEKNAREELEKHPPETWSLKMGTRHIKVFVGKTMVGISRGFCSKSSQGAINDRSVLNLRSAIRREFVMQQAISTKRVAPAETGGLHGRARGQASPASPG